MDASDIVNYEARQIRIEEDVRAIKAHLGVSDEWDAHSAQVSKSLEGTDGQKSSLKHTWAGHVLVPITGESTTQMEHSNRSKTREGNTRMKEYLKKLGRTKFQAFLVATFTNIGLLIGYLMNVNNVQSEVSAYTPLFIGLSQLVAGMVYQWVEGAVDKAKATNGISDVEKSYHGE